MIKMFSGISHFLITFRVSQTCKILFLIIVSSIYFVVLKSSFMHQWPEYELYIGPHISLLAKARNAPSAQLVAAICRAYRHFLEVCIVPDEFCL